MYIYCGKLNWLQYAVNETFTVVFPSTFSKGDPVNAFWQWTVDKDGKKKTNNNYVGTISRADPSTSKLVLFGPDDYYNFDAVKSEDGKILTVTLRSKSHSEPSSAMKLDRVTSNVPDPSRQIGCSIYSGKLNYYSFASNEMITVIIPASYGFKVPIVAVWQWTKDAEGASNKTRIQTQDAIDDIQGNSMTFFKANYYQFSGTESGKDLKLKMTGKDGLSPVDLTVTLAYNWH
ncbi:MAG: hypothetical protein M1839_005889 [Geoglossum umbratile]|nr:MAG: hypothetical protein M1839_005889 [Geoglossum umbratile]